MKVRSREEWRGGGPTTLHFIMEGTWTPCFSGPRPDPFDQIFIYSPYQAVFEMMGDVTGAKDVGEWKDCDHYRRFIPQTDALTVMQVVSDARVSTGYNSCGSHDAAMCRDPMLAWYRTNGERGRFDPWSLCPKIASETPDEDGHFVPLPSSWDDLNTRAISQMWPSIRAELSSINSLIELKDFRTLGASLLEQWRLFSSLAKTIIGKGSVSQTLRQLFHAGADGYLQLQFNILPLIKDITSVMHVMSSVERAIARLITEAGRKQTKHMYFAWREFDDLIGQKNSPSSAYTLGPDSKYPLLVGASEWEFDAIHKDSVFRAEIQYNYSLSEWEVVHARLLGFLDALGVNANLAIIWNAIPYSFIVDWVLGVSQYLSSIKIPNLNPVVNITNYCASVKRSRTINSKFNYWGWQGYVEKRACILPQVSETAYRRVVGLPSTVSLSTSGISSVEFTLGAALAYLKLVRKPRHRHWKPPKYPRPPRSVKSRL